MRKGNEAGTCKNLVREKEGGSMGFGNVCGRGEREREEGDRRISRVSETFDNFQ